VVVASAGNDATWLTAYPAAFPDVVSVAALDADGPADYTNHGPWVRARAPEQIWSAPSSPPSSASRRPQRGRR
jgi:subtilisin family serine protease